MCILLACSLDPELHNVWNCLNHLKIYDSVIIIYMLILLNMFFLLSGKMAANIFIKVALHPQGQTVSLPTTNGNLSMQTLSSQFPTATGLKYMLNGSWMAVPVEEGTFHIPENMDTFIAVSASVGKFSNTTAINLRDFYAQNFEEV